MPPPVPPGIDPPPAIAWLYGLQKFGVKLGLDPMRAMLARLGDPQRRLRAIHVAGTNGKGSVSAMLDAMLGSAGVRTGLYTSPHLVRPNERVRIAGRDLGDRELTARIERMRARIAGWLADGTLEAHPSFFEVMTAIAFESFADAGVEAAVVEVGLGGRLDATNVLDADVAVIVTVDLDHTRVLGDSLEAIAAEKAGIVKAGRPVVVGALAEPALRVVRATAEELRAPLIEAPRVARRHVGVRLALEGAHQSDNAHVACVAAETFARATGIGLGEDAIARGLANARWPGRLQRIPGRPPIVLDGAHNPAGARALGQWLASRAAAAPARVLVFGVSADKDLAGLLEPLAPWIGCLVVTRAAVDRAMDPEAIVAFARGRFAQIHRAEPAEAALQLARELAGDDGEVLVAGSLYLVGELLAHLDSGDAPGPVPL